MSQKEFNRELSGYLGDIRKKKSVADRMAFFERIKREKSSREVDEEHPKISETGVTLVPKDRGLADKLLDFLTSKSSKAQQEDENGFEEDSNTERLEEEQITGISDSEFAKQEQEFEEEIKEAGLIDRLKDFLLKPKSEQTEAPKEFPDDVEGSEAKGEGEGYEVVYESHDPSDMVTEGSGKGFVDKIVDIFRSKPVEDVSDGQVSGEGVRIDPETEQVIKELIKVNVSLVNKMRSSELSKFKESEDFSRFKGAVDRYKGIAGKN